MSGPWYEQRGPNTDEVRKRLTADYIMPKYKYRLITLNTIKDIINNVMLEEEKQYEGWGSYRGYYTFTHHKLIKKINKQVQAIMETNARNKINYFVMNSPWVADLLYRPPTDDKPTGRMYFSTQNNFTCVCNEYKSKQSHLEI